jgi:hypothetical protein
MVSIQSLEGVSDRVSLPLPLASAIKKSGVGGNLLLETYWV